jgi:hypothetical protein
MAVTRTGRSSAVASASQLFEDDSVDRDVFIYVNGAAEQRIAFAEADVPTTTSGFLIPPGGIKFRLQAGDELWVTGQTSQDASFIYFIVTKAS